MTFDGLLGIYLDASPVVVTLLSVLEQVSETCNNQNQRIQEFVGGYCNTCADCLASPAIPWGEDFAHSSPHHMMLGNPYH